MKKTDPPIVLAQTINESIATLWRALTDPKQMKQWFFENLKTFEPKVGFETKFIVENEGRIFPHLWKLTEVVPLKKITYNWRYEGYAGDSFVTFELFDQGKSTKLMLTHTVTEDFPSIIPEFTRENCIEGWDYFINQRLKDFLKLKYE